MLTTFILPNGIKVAAYNLPGLKSVHIRLTSKGGSFIETDTNSGLAHFMEHMLLQGTPTFPTGQKLAESVELLAGHQNASTSPLLVSYYLTLPSTHLTDGLKIASETYFDSLFPPDAIEREKGAVLSEIKGRKNSDSFKFWNFWKDIRYRLPNPLTRTVVGEPETVSSFTREQVVEFAKKFLCPKNTYAILCGHFDPKSLKAEVSSYFKSANSGTPLKFPNFTQDIFSARVVALNHQPDMQANKISLSFPAVTMSDPPIARTSQVLALAILANLQTSRLFRKLRQEAGLVYFVHAYQPRFPKAGLVDLYFEATSENVTPALKIIAATLKDLLENGPTNEEFVRVQNYRINTALMAFDHPGSIAEWIEDDLLWEKTIELPEAYAKRVERLKKADLLAAMKNHWDFQKLNLIIQGPLEDTPSKKAELEALLAEL